MSRDPEAKAIEPSLRQRLDAAEEELRVARVEINRATERIGDLEELLSDRVGFDAPYRLRDPAPASR